MNGITQGGTEYLLMEQHTLLRPFKRGAMKRQTMLKTIISRKQQCYIYNAKVPL